ncbi:pimeloyl-ACP methyl ester esterase BioH [soil metagenome]
MKLKLHTTTLGYGEPLLMIHGWGWHSGIWQSLLPQLTTQYRITLVDLPGFGLSPSILQQNYTLNYIVELLLEVAPNSAHWLGWSLGGLLATAAALHSPHRVRSVINVTSSPCFTQEEEWPGMKHTTLQNFAELLSSDYQKTLRDFLILQLHGTANARPLFRQLQTDVLYKYVPEVASLAGSLQLLRQNDLRSSLVQLQCPCLYIFGRLDALIPVTVIPRLQHYLPQAQSAIIERASHMPFLSHRDEFMGLLDKFITKERL